MTTSLLVFFSLFSLSCFVSIATCDEVKVQQRNESVVEVALGCFIGDTTAVEYWVILDKVEYEQALDSCLQRSTSAFSIALASLDSEAKKRFVNERLRNTFGQEALPLQEEDETSLQQETNSRIGLWVSMSSMSLLEGTTVLDQRRLRGRTAKETVIEGREEKEDPEAVAILEKCPAFEVFTEDVRLVKCERTFFYLCQREQRADAGFEGEEPSSCVVPDEQPTASPTPSTSSEVTETPSASPLSQPSSPSVKEDEDAYKDPDDPTSVPLIPHTLLIVYVTVPITVFLCLLTNMNSWCIHCHGLKRRVSVRTQSLSPIMNSSQNRDTSQLASAGNEESEGVRRGNRVTEGSPASMQESGESDLEHMRRNRSNGTERVSF